jgi:general secretion pathway protein H
LGPELTPNSQRGVTLVELLIVVSILAFVAAVVALNAPPNRSNAQEEAERFAARAKAAAEYAVIAGRPTAIEVSASGFRVLVYSNGAWRDAPDRRQGRRSFPNGVGVALAMEDPSYANRVRSGDARDEAPRRILFDPIGAATPFAIEFSSRRGRWRIERSADGRLSVSEHGVR